MQYFATMPASQQFSSLAALRALIEAGASDQLLAQAARELVARESMRQPSPVPSESAPARNADQPVTSSSTRLPEAPGRAATPAPVPAKPELVMFRDSSGARSSINIKPTAWAELAALAPKGFDLKGRARELASAAPEGVQRSAYVCEQLKAELEARKGRG